MGKKERVIQGHFETMLRLLLEMATMNKPQSSLRIALFDYMATYGSDFLVSSNNLHGEGRFKKTEIVARVKMTDKLLPKLVMLGYVIPKADEGCFVYELTDLGRTYAMSLDSEYSNEYKETLIKMPSYMTECSDANLFDKVLSLSQNIFPDGGES